MKEKSPGVPQPRRTNKDKPERKAVNTESQETVIREAKLRD